MDRRPPSRPAAAPARRRRAALGAAARGVALAGVALAAAALAGCAEADRYVYQGLVGERPGDRPLFVETGMALRLGRPGPTPGAQRFRPAPPPPGRPESDRAPLHALGGEYERVRQLISDREDEYLLRRRGMDLNLAEFYAAARAVTLRTGAELPSYDDQFRARLAAMRAAHSRLQGDVVSVNATMVRLERHIGAAEALAPRVAAAPGRAEAGAYAAALDRALKASIESATAMRKHGNELIARFLDYLSEQDAAMTAIETQVKEGGVRPAEFGRTLIPEGPLPNPFRRAP